MGRGAHPCPAWHCAARGVELKWFGAEDPVAFTSRYDSWRYAPPQRLPRTDAILAGLIDMRLPLTFSTDDAADRRDHRDEVQARCATPPSSDRP
jgi:hypothetical protein